jgi:hypothetical protein
MPIVFSIVYPKYPQDLQRFLLRPFAYVLSPQDLGDGETSLLNAFGNPDTYPVDTLLLFLSDVVDVTVDILPGTSLICTAQPCGLF